MSGRSGWWWTSASLCTLVALFSYRYFFGVGPVPPTIAANLQLRPWLVVHVAGAATALLVGPLQLLAGLRARRPMLHRVLGRVYVAGCFGGGLAGLVLATGASTGPVTTVGLGGLGLAWIGATALAFAAALQRRLVAHRAWMIRSFALTFSAVTLRLYLQLLFVLPVRFDDGYRAISFLCWVPNLMVAELWLRRDQARRAVAAAA